MALAFSLLAYVTHLQAMVLFALFISVAFAFLAKSRRAERIRYALWSFLAFVAIAILVGWLAFFSPR
jgi:multidrug transporter EmrE-like cation transporter